MKTRKYKDNQQRKKFAQNESKILLIQYFKKKETESTVQSFSSNSEVIRNGKGTHSSQVSTAAKTLRIPKVSQSCLANSNPNYKKWSSFKYPKNLSAFFFRTPFAEINISITKFKGSRQSTGNRRFPVGSSTDGPTRCQRNPTC